MKGEQQARAAGIALQRLGAEFEVVLFSPKTRARKTAELAAAQWTTEQRERLRSDPALAGGFDARQALEALSSITADGRLLLVGHEPDLSGVAGDLTGGLVDLKKGGLAVVRLESVAGELVVLMRPRELALIAGIPVDGN
jgi:phosphohistidine phosphatase